MRRATIVTLLLSIAAIAFAQGLRWQQKTTGTPDGDHTSDFYMVQRKCKSVDQQNNEVMIIRLDRQLIWTLDTKKKTYQEMTFAQLEQMVNKMSDKMNAMQPKMDEAQAEMEREMANMPEEQRKMVEQMMKSKMPGMGAGPAAAIDVETTGETKTISGYNCKKYLLKSGDEILSTVWATRDVREFTPFMSDWKELTKRLSGLQRMAKGMGDALAKIDGCTVQTNMKLMGMDITTTNSRIERASPAASEFDIPSGYTKVKSELEKAMQDN
jgi:GLPGLI family protein